jgi:hypothetical protein
MLEISFNDPSTRQSQNGPDSSVDAQTGQLAGQKLEDRNESANSKLKGMHRLLCQQTAFTKDGHVTIGLF